MWLYLRDVPMNEGAAERYDILVQGHLDARWASWFDGLCLTRRNDGTTLIQGAVVDQSALHGLLGKVRDLGIPLIAVHRREER